ncbi:MAG TPA: methyltransferase domain-containing protein [Pyrinomonadaceae bacterium]|nr:methyltransferase domain-containing protein [Pyrinomonadaceae bacterium]
MRTDNAAFVGSIPENYDRYLGPVLFDPYAADLAARVDVPEGGAVLELACGTGIVTRRLRDRLAPTTKLVATDLNEAMISYASRKFSRSENIEWKQADATCLPFSDQSFDAVVCQFGLMFVPDKPQALREVYRVLKPRGRFVFNVWDAIEQNDLARTAHETIAKFFDDNPPDFYQIPFSFHDSDAIRSLLSYTGFREVDATLISLPSKASSAQELAKGLVHGNPIINAIRERNESRIPEIELSVAKAVATLYGEAPVQAQMRALICTATR